MISSSRSGGRSARSVGLTVSPACQSSQLARLSASGNTGAGGRLARDHQELLLEPGVQHSVRAIPHALDAHRARGWMKEGQHFGGAVAQMLVWVPDWTSEWLPADTRLGNGLVRPSFIHAPNGQTQPLSFGVRLLDERFFWCGIRIVNLHLDHHSATLTAPFGLARVAPAPIALPTQTCLVQHAQDRVGADEGQAIRGATQRALQRRQRPGGGAVALPIRFSVELAQDALLGGRIVQNGRAASMAWFERCQPLAIEHTDQGRHRVARTPTSQVGSLGVRVAIGHRHQRFRPSDERGRQSERSANAFKVRPLLWTQWSERVLLDARHGTSSGREEPAYTPVLAQLYRNAKSRDI